MIMAIMVALIVLMAALLLYLCYTYAELKGYLRALNDVGEDAISREYIVKKLRSSKEFYVLAWKGFSNMGDRDKARCDELDNCIAIAINAPSVIPKTIKGED